MQGFAAVGNDFSLARPVLGHIYYAVAKGFLPEKINLIVNHHLNPFGRRI
jgi:hypothetical protein